MLKQALQSALDKCTSCEETGPPHRSRKVSLTRLLLPFNQHVHIDYLFVFEFVNTPILHMVDSETAFSVATLLESRQMQVAAKSLNWLGAMFIDRPHLSLPIPNSTSARLLMR